ncbi:MAG: Homocysteine S-methyltransferase [Benjaminiella poitrasii]|nr:MAG: Homocysteine S-methyltransferase [Benjaminiella poitrasii]
MSVDIRLPLILDGGFATELERSFGKDLSGANVATTCSYQASLEGFTNEGYSEEQAIELMRKSVTLACEARQEFQQDHPNNTEQRLVALSIGCYGAVLANGAEYTGDYGAMTVNQIAEFHKKRLCIFLSRRQETVDFIMFETIPSYLEAQAIRQVILDWTEDEARDVPRLPPIVVSFQCRSSDQIADGTPVLHALAEFKDLELVFATGFNCTKPKFAEALMTNIARYNQDSNGNKALVSYPDGGEEWNAVARSWDKTAKLPEESFGCIMADFIKKYGPRVLVGGCCGTGPSHIKSIKEFLVK